MAVITERKTGSARSEDNTPEFDRHKPSRDQNPSPQAEHVWADPISANPLRPHSISCRINRNGKSLTDGKDLALHQPPFSLTTITNEPPRNIAHRIELIVLRRGQIDAHEQGVALGPF
ncbi:MAG: hypothetical protein ABIS43_11275 [Opitutus sp.]